MVRSMTVLVRLKSSLDTPGARTNTGHLQRPIEYLALSPGHLASGVLGESLPIGCWWCASRHPQQPTDGREGAAGKCVRSIFRSKGYDLTRAALANYLRGTTCFVHHCQ